MNTTPQTLAYVHAYNLELDADLHTALERRNIGRRTREKKR